MTAQDCSAPARDGPRFRTAAAFARRVRQAVQGLVRRIEREALLRTAEHRLHSMSDGMLKDIGISRGDIRRRVRDGVLD